MDNKYKPWFDGDTAEAEIERLNARIAELEEQLAAAQERYVLSQSEHLEQLAAAQERGAEQQRIIDRLVAAAQGRKEAEHE